jgi:hypothetical protein
MLEFFVQIAWLTKPGNCVKCDTTVPISLLMSRLFKPGKDARWFVDERMRRNDES